VTTLMIAAITEKIFMLLLGVTALFLILLVLVQRGRGGGLAGALGGMGGSSAFGAKAGDVFTKITIGAATVWILLCIAATKLVTSGESRIDVEGKGPPSSAIDSTNTEQAPTAKLNEDSGAATGTTDASGESGATATADDTAKQEDNP